MSTRTSIATVVILAAGLLTGEVRADCLDGHLDNFTISAQVNLIYGATWFGVCPPPEKMTSPSDGLECPIPYPCCAPGECDPCSAPGPKASYSVSTSPTGYTITATVEVDPTVDDLTGRHGFLHEASVVVDVDFERVGGFVDCTFHGVNRRLAGGVVFEWGYDPRFNLTCIASENYLPGAVTCEATATCTPIAPSQTRYWSSPSGGAYEDGTKWSGGCAPAYDGQRSDTAMFNLATATHIPVTAGPLATALDWVVRNSLIDFSGSGHVYSSLVINPSSLEILDGGQLRLASGASLDSVHTSVGVSGLTNSVLEIKGAQWTNTESAKIGRGSVDVLDGGTASTKALTVGSGNGAATVHVTGDRSGFIVDDMLVVGDTTAGTLEIDKGVFGVTSSTRSVQIGKSAPGTVTVRGDESSSYGSFFVNHSLLVGNEASGRLNIMRGGSAKTSLDLVVNQGATGAGEVVVDGQGGDSVLEVRGGTFVNATELREVLLQNGGRLSTNDLFIGNRQVRPGAADVTLRGASGIFPTLTVGTAGGQGVGTLIGQAAPGQLNVEDGARAELYNGLRVGSAAQGIVSISSLNHPPGILSTLTVTGETQVGIGVPGIVQLDAVGQMENNGDMKIGLGGDNPSGSVNLADGSYLRVNGVLTVGASGIGLLNILSGSAVRCDTLLVGGNTSGATGIIVEAFFSYLTVDGNTQVGVGTGHGEILLADPEARLAINGTMTIGNPNGGPGGGAVALVDARIEGTGRIVVNPNGSLIGTGTVAVIKVDAGGIISPGLSPGTLTIEGDYELLHGGTQIIEYAGLNPGEFDVLHVTGQTTLGGRLEVHFRNGFSPEDPAAFIQSQDFVETDGTTTGDYAERIYAFPDLFADFDNDGDKDLSDMAAFQNCFGRSGAGLLPQCARADWENNGVLDEVDVRELVARLDGADGIACPPGGSCPIVECDAAVLDNPTCGGLDDADDDCYRGTCTLLGCVTTPEPFGSPCDDHIACTTRSVCGFGPTEFGCFAQDLADIDDALCPDHDLSDADCLRDVCDRALGCVRAVEPPGSPCDDGVGCTFPDSCMAGQCEAGPSVCGNEDDADEDCFRSVCDPVEDCLLLFEPEGSPCFLLECDKQELSGICNAEGVCQCRE